MEHIEIIDNPEKKSFLRKGAEAAFTVLMWGIWSYLLLPILNLILWLIGIRIFYLELVAGSAYPEFLALARSAGWIVLTIFVILRCWGLYNYWKFGKVNRRTSVSSDFGERQLSEHFQVSSEIVRDLRTQKEVLWPARGDESRNIADWLSAKKK
jgi:poly-beta-1,6-N-acetyl-D-glucosamine biosynthesis protein PgaD